MPEWLGENPVATLIICVILLGLLCLITVKAIKKRKKGGCACGCASCPMKNGCANNKEG